MHTEVEKRFRGLHFDSSHLANPELVSSAAPVTGGSSGSASSKRQFIDNSSVRKGTPASQKTQINGMSIIRKCYTDQKFSPKARVRMSSAGLIYKKFGIEILESMIH